MKGCLRLEFFDEASLEQLKPRWDDLELRALATAFQSYDYVKSAIEAFSQTNGDKFKLLLLSECASDRAVFIMPFVSRLHLGVRLLEALDYYVVDYSTALLDPVLFQDSDLLDEASKLLKIGFRGHDVVLLRNQISGPTAFDHIMRRIEIPLQDQDTTYQIPLGMDVYHAYQKTCSVYKKAQKNRRRLERDFDFTIETAITAQAIDTVLDVMFEQRAVRFQKLGITDGLADPRRQAFFRKLAHARCADGRALLIGGKCGNTCVATTFAVCGSDTVTGQLCSFAEGPWHKFSPGHILTSREIDWAFENGFSTYDLGAGEADYKSRFGAISKSRRSGERALTTSGQIYLTVRSAKKLAKQQLQNSKSSGSVTSKAKGVYSESEFTASRWPLEREL